MQEAVDAFIRYLVDERAVSPNTLRAYRRDVADLVEHLGGSEAGLSRDAVRGLLAKLHEEGRAKSTVARKLAAIRTFVRFLRRTGRIASDPVAAVRAPRRPRLLPRPLGEEEVQRLLQAPADDGDAAFPARDVAILELLYATGFRVAEVARLETSDLDLEAGTARTVAKGRRVRVAPLGRPAIQAIRAYLSTERPEMGIGRGPDEPPPSALFLNRFGERLTSRSIRRVVERYARRTGLPAGVSPHTLRHSFATHILNNGADLRVVQELLGHARLSSTQIYTRVSARRLLDTYESAHPRALTA